MRSSFRRCAVELGISEECAEKAAYSDEWRVGRSKTDERVERGVQGRPLLTLQTPKLDEERVCRSSGA